MAKPVSLRPALARRPRQTSHTGSMSPGSPTPATSSRNSAPGVPLTLGGSCREVITFGS
jgi:hypothetical protein